MNDDWHKVAHCAGWDYHRFADGPLARVLLHRVVDPVALLRGDTRRPARASVRMVLRNGTVFGAVVTAPHDNLLAVLQQAASLLIGHDYDEAAFNTADALLAAHLKGARISLERNATVLPRPLLMPDQIARLAQAMLGPCPPAAASQLRAACRIIDPAVVAYGAGLDMQGRDYCAAAQAVHGVRPDSLTVYNFVAAARGHARNRAQALQALPWLLPILTAPANAGNRVAASSILAAIDRGLPLHAAVAQAFAVPRETVRWLGSRTLPANRIVDAGRLQRLLTLLSWLAPERRPQTLAHFDILTTQAAALTAPLGFRGAASDAATFARIGPCMRRWLEREIGQRRGQGQGAAADNATRWAADLADARDFLRALFEARQAADGLDAAVADAWVLDWCAQRGVARLLALSRAWHTAIAAAAWSGADDTGMHWPAMLVQPWQGDDRTVVELTSRGQLRAEGRHMAHCVGSYADACQRRNSVVVSLRDSTGVPVSTAELSLDHRSLHLAIVQHRGLENAAAGAACRRSLHALLAVLNGAAYEHLRARRHAFQQQQHAACSSGAGETRFNHVAQEAARRLAIPTIINDRRKCIG